MKTTGHLILQNKVGGVVGLKLSSIIEKLNEHRNNCIKVQEKLYLRKLLYYSRKHACLRLFRTDIQTVELSMLTQKQDCFISIAFVIFYSKF